jgi:acetolactate decarboxylase
MEIDAAGRPEGAQGVVFGFLVPEWLEGVCGPRMHCHVVFGDQTGASKAMDGYGGRVLEFTTQGEVELAKTGRFHLGFPRGDEWESANLAK